jgi:hypothetical protein
MIAIGFVVSAAVTALKTWHDFSVYGTWFNLSFPPGSERFARETTLSLWSMLALLALLYLTGWLIRQRDEGIIAQGRIRPLTRLKKAEGPSRVLFEYEYMGHKHVRWAKESSDPHADAIAFVDGRRPRSVVIIFLGTKRH